MSELHKFLFEGAPVRGMIVRLDDAWTEILERRRVNESTGPWPVPVAEMLGEMAAAGALMQSNIKFNGALVMQIYGDGPVKVAVAEVQHDLSVRVTAKVVGEVDASAHLSALVNLHGGGRCAITLDPKDRRPGQQAYQGVVPLHGAHGEKLERLSDVLEHYMRQSEQLDTKLVLAADQKVAAGLLIQRLPLEGERNLQIAPEADSEAARMEDFNRIAMLAASLRRDELLELDVETILRRRRPSDGGRRSARCRPWR
jgi:molecular chaperone Hsp33